MDRALDDDRKQQEQLDAQVAVEAAPPDRRGEAAVLANLHTLGPGDADLLAQRLRDFPQLHDLIIEWAMAHLGNATVHAALTELDKGAIHEGAKQATDDAFVKEQLDVMAEQKSDDEFVAFEMGVMAAEKQEEPAKPDDATFVEEQMAEMKQEQSDEEFAAYQMGVMTQEAKDDAFVQEQLGEIQQQDNDEAFVAEQMGVMAQAQSDEQFVQEQIDDAAKRQSDEEFVKYQLGVMEAEQKHEHGAEAPAAEHKKSAEEAAPEEKQLVETVAQAPEAAPEVLGTALAEQPQLREPLLEQATEVHGAAVVEQAVEVEHQEQAAAGPQADAAPVVEQTTTDQPTVVEAEAQGSATAEEAWFEGARRYNEDHAALVEMFNELTDNQYVLPDGTVSPEVIVAWQEANGVAVDGRIGPETVAAAKAGAKKVTLADAARKPEVEEEIVDDELPPP